MLAIVMTLVLGFTLAAPATAQPTLDKMREMFKGVGRSAPAGLSESRIADGLKEALRLGTDHAVARTGVTDGFFGNPLIKILLPDKLQSLEKGLRMVGYGEQVDAFVLSMNRAAERAAPQARAIFLDAITSMTFDDARRILDGGETAATDFFKARTSDRLYAAFRPVVDQTLNQVGTVQTYNDMLAQAKRLPFVKTASLDVGDYVTHKALDGLFVVVAEEERNIRKNPAARVSQVLQEVFGR